MKRLIAVAVAVAGLVGAPGELRAEDLLDLWHVANPQHTTAKSLLDDERYAEAIPPAESALKGAEEIVRRLHVDPEHLPRTLPKGAPEALTFLGKTLTFLAVALMESGDYVRPEPLLGRARVIAERFEGINIDPTYELARLYEKRGDLARAEPLLERAAATSETIWRKGNWINVTRMFTELGRLRLASGDHASAEPLLQRAFEENYFLRSDTIFHIGLAELHLARGDLARAEDLLRGALKDVRFHDKTRSPMRARLLDALAAVYVRLGEPARAEPLYQEAIALREKAFGPEHPDLAISLDGLARIRLEGPTPTSAEALLGRALAIQEKAYQPDYPDKAITLELLGELRRSSGDLKAAEPLYARALAAREQSFGPDHLVVAEPLLALGDLHQASGDLQQAEARYRRALAIREKRRGPDHLSVAEPLDHLAELSLRQGKIAPALLALSRSATLRDRGATAVLASGSNPQKRAYLGGLARQTDLILSLRVEGAPVDPGAASLMLTTILRRKGRLLDALSDSRAALRDRHAPEDQALLKELVAIQTRIVDLLSSGPGRASAFEHRSALEELERQKQRLEAEVSRRSAALRTDDPMVTVEQVQAVIPDGAALVELFVYQPFRPASPGEKRALRVAVLGLRSRGGVTVTDLGDAAEIEARAAELRETLADPTRDPRKLARGFFEKEIRPLRGILGETRRILLSPDGALNLVPVGALLDDQGRYLIETTSFTYLTSGRDLVRYTYNETPKEPGLPALVIGSPDFGDPKKKHSRFRPEAELAVGKRSVDMSAIRFPSLPGTGAEAKAIGAALPGAKVLLGAEATEAALKAERHPRILHVASHGFFLPDQAASARAGQRGFTEGTFENPLLRAGVALASANQPVLGEEDGILTALEASGLDLYGTRLVVLSACETGVGEASNGEGVYGLRRALVMAGAQTQVMSLWKISDEGTRELMVAYYQRLMQGGGRSEAMRQVALTMLTNPKRKHPYYWASFIVSGDGSSLDGKEVPPDAAGLARVPPGARGCGCAVVGEARGERAALFVIAALGWMAARRAGRRGRA